MVVVAGLRAAQTILIPLLVAIFLAILCVPAVRWLQRRMPTVVAVLLVVVAVMGVLAGVGAMIGGSVNEFTAALPQYQARLTDLLRSMAVWLRGHRIDVSGDRLSSIVSVSSVMGMMAGTLKTLAAAVSNVVMVLLILVFTLLEAAGLPAKVRSALGSPGADLGRFSVVMVEVQHYLGIKTAVSLVTGVLLGGWLAILGVDFALLWGLLAFLLNYIPNLGSIIAAVPPVILALIQLGPGRALLAAGGFVVVNMVLGNVVEPQLMGRRLGLSPLVVFLSLVFWGWVWGPVGMLLSVPLTMVVKILLENTEDLRWVAVMLDSSPRLAEELPVQPPESSE